MITGIVDSTVIIHLYRKNANAIRWLNNQTDKIGVTSITWLEIIRGAHSKQKQATSLGLLSLFDLIYLNENDQLWAMEQMQKHRLSLGIEMNDCLIASVTHRLKIPIYTHNQKDMLKILPTQLVVLPYQL
ncbi:MAG: PIN domain-containing protein [Anaerolineae bacterium]|nr:PIN domain-containing protein [Anaerolineae bacterium]